MYGVYKMQKENAIVHIDDLTAMKQELLDKVGALQLRTETRTEEVAKLAKESLQPVADQAANSAADFLTFRGEARVHTKESCDALKSHLTELIDSVRASLLARMDDEVGAIRSQANTLASKHESTQATLEELAERMQAARAELDSGHAERSALTKQASEQERRFQNTLEGSMAAWKQSIHEEHMADQEERERVVRDRLMEKIGETTAKKIAETADQVMGDMQRSLKRHDESIRDIQKTLHESIVEHGAKLDEVLHEHNAAAEKRVANMEQDCLDLRQAVAANASIGTRTVEWVIPDLLRQLTGASQSWFSPRFSAAGEVGLQLELQVAYNPLLIESATEVALTKAGGTEGEVAKTTKKERELAAAKSTIECKVLLWAGSSSSAGEGPRLVFKLAVAGMSGPKQENRFESWGPCASGRVWKLDERNYKDDGGLRVAAEFLAATGSLELRHQPPAARTFVPGWSPIFAENSADPAKAAACLPELAIQRIGTLCVKRSIDNRSDDRTRSCMVRRIDWQLHQISSLKTCMPRGQCIYSTHFDAAGMEGLQLVFFPNGCDGAPSGYCSFFMHCPDGMPRAWLHVGKHRVEALNEEYQPGWVGRIRFWHCEKYPDAETDSVSLAVEIQEAPFDALRVRASNDPRRFLRNSFAGGVELRLPSTARPKSTSSPKRKLRPAPPVSDSTLARGADTSKYIAQAYLDSAQGYVKSTPPRSPSKDGSPTRMPQLAPSPSLGNQTDSVDPMAPF